MTTKDSTPRLDDLFEIERAFNDGAPSPEVRAAIVSKVSATVTAIALARPMPELPQPPGGAAAAPPGAAGTVAGGIVSNVLAKGISLVALGALAGAGTTVAVLGAPAPAPLPEIRYVEKIVVERPAPVAPPPSAAVASATKESAPPIATARHVASPDISLASERALLETAHAAVGRRDGAAALRALDEHARQFPNGRLGEEREALAVLALAQEGRTEEARARALAFRRRYPNGLFLPVVDGAIQPR